MTSARTTSRRVPLVESLESRQFLCATVAAADTANLTVAHANTAPIVMKAAAAAANGQVIWGEAKAGVKLKFKKTKGLQGNGVLGIVNESGTFTDEKGNSGTYTMFLSKLPTGQGPQILTLKFKSKVAFTRSISMQFTPIGKRLVSGANGKTITFTSAAAGTSAKGIVLSTTGLSLIYLKY